MMLTRAFWEATLERVIRGGAVAVAAGWSGDAVFNVLEVKTLKDVASLFVSGAVASLVLCLGGQAVTKSGPSFNNAETLEPQAPQHRAPEAGQVSIRTVVYVLAAAVLVILLFLLTPLNWGRG